MTDAVRVAVAGAGRFGQEHLRALARMNGVKLVGIADVNAAAAEQSGKRYGAAWSTDAAALVEQERPDGLIVATPGHTHVALASHALARGISVLVEKPVAMSAAEAAVLAQAESGSRGFVLPGHILRFSEPHRRFAEMVRSDAIGPLVSVTSRRHRDDSHAARYPDIDSVLMTMIHDIDLAVWLTGAAVAEVLAVRRPAGTPRSEVMMTATDTKGAIWHLTTAWTFPTEETPPDRIEVIGERGSVELDVGGQIRQYGKVSRRIDLAGPSLDDALQAELSCFAEAIRSGERPRIVTMRDACTGLAVADAVLESLRTGTLVRVPSPPQ
jgi:predicted dehydrogenase